MVGQTGGTNSDSNGLSLMLGDSRTAANNFGFKGTSFANEPKSKFLFYVKFYRPQAAGGSTWEKGIGATVKTVDRPRVSFETQTLNQYNRKRIVQTSHEFEDLQLKFHDTVDETILKMFSEYYRYYYGDSNVAGVGTSVYDVVTGEPYELGKWGFLPPLEDQNYGYFFSHISVYQFYQGHYSQFDLINPKISSYNPDDFDYAAGNISNEIALSVKFENIVYHEAAALTPAMWDEFGLNRGQFWDVKDEGFQNARYGIGNGDPSGSTGNAIANVLRQNLASLVTGQGTQGLGGIVAGIAGQFDANRGLAIGKTGVNSLKDLVSGNTKSATQGVQGLLKGTLFGSPGKFF